MPHDSTFPLTYRFRFPDGVEKEFLVRLDRKNCAAIVPERPQYPDWTRLEFKQCGHCPLSRELHTHCPVAVNIVEIVQFFQDSQSVDQAYVEVETPTASPSAKRQLCFQRSAH